MADREPGQDDRYRPLRQLGEGGAGRVWLVEDRLRPGVRIALKELAETSRGHEESLRREFATLAGLRHPNLVEVHDLDVSPETGLPRFTLEYVDGEDLVATVASEGPKALPGLAAEVLRALAFLHDFGLIHRDLKPGNLLVRRTPRLGCRVVVLDFGLALRGGAADEIPETDGKTSDASTGAAGTLPYLAPELFEGERADRRSDLYALGAVLYEAVHGRTPFTLDGKDLMAFIGAVREGRRARPPLPDGYPPGLAGFLEELLSPDPATRPGDALEVLARLNAACGTKLAAEIPATRAARLGSGVPVGRDEELKALWEHLDPVEGPRVVWLCGGAGAGKTRVLRWLAGDAVVRGWEVESPPLGLPLWDESGKSEEDALSTYLGGLRDRAAKGPTLLLLDEVESATGRVASLLERAGREGKAPPLRVVAALRPAEVRQPVVLKLLSDTGIVPTLRRIDLEPFGSDGVRAMAARATGTGTVSGTRVEWLLDASEGNPLVAESLLVEGVWEKGGRARRSRAIAASIAGRLELLSDNGRRVLEALSVIGEVAQPELVAAVASLPADEVHESASEIVAVGLGRASDGTWTVESKAVSELIKEGLSSERLRELHRGAANLIVAQQSKPLNHTQLARLWSGAGETEQAIESAVRAAEQATRRDDHAAAAESYRMALVQLGRNRDARRRGLRLKQAEALLAAALFKEAVRASGIVVRASVSESEKARAYFLRSQALSLGGRFELAKSNAEKALSAAEQVGSKEDRARALKVLGTTLGRLGREREAVPVLEEASKALEEVGDTRMCAEALAHLGVCEVRLLLPGSGEHMERARELAQASGNTRQEVYALISLSDHHHRLQDDVTARRALDEARDLAASVHPSPMLAFVLGAQAIACVDSGRFDRAIQLAREAEDHAWHFADLDSAVFARNTLANAILLGGRPAEASAVLRGILEQFTGRVEPRRINITRLTYAEALLESPDGDLELAQHLIHESIESSRRRGDSMGVLSGLVVELERRARRECLDPFEPIEREYSELLAQRVKGVPPEFRIRGGCALAAYALKEGDPQSARQSLEAAAQHSRKVGFPWLTARVCALLADVLEQLGNHEEAASVTAVGQTALAESANRIEDQDLRRDFLNRTVFHRLRSPASGASSVADQRLAALYDMIRALNSETDPEILLESIVDMALEVVAADRGMILLREPGGDEFRVRVAQNVEEETEQDAEAFSHSIVSQAGQGRSIMAVDAGTDERFRDLRSVSLFKIRSLMCVPLRSRGTIVGTVYLDSRSKGRVFKQDDLRFVEAFADHAALALENARVRARLETENRRLLAVAEERVRFDKIVGRSSVMQKVFDMIEKVAESELPVLIQGESGTGKELVARAVHFHGPRKTKLILSENCAAIPESLLESALFGHVRGAFTGADRDRIGLFEQADGGTLFLDEVGDMSPAMQARLLRVLEDGEVRRVGGESSIHVDVRLLAATNRQLQERVEAGRFREDLFYRLQVLTIELPPLRERHGDIPLLVSHMLERIARERNRPAPSVESDVLEILERYPWPGNVRQLENTLQRLALLAGDGAISRSLIDEEPALRKALLGGLADDETVFSLEKSEREQIRRALESSGGNRNRAAKLLGISRATIYRKIKEYDLR